MKSRQHRRRVVRHAPVPFERLERRRLLSGGVTISTPPNVVLVSGEATFSGTAKADLILVYATPQGGNFVSINGHVTDAGFAALKIFANAGDDVVSIETPYGYPITIYGGAGNDTILGGAGAEHIFAGDGNDSVNAGDSRDTVYGEAGDDFLRGGGSSDLLDGGDGADTLMGDAGNDHLFGDANPDRLRGGDGNDDLHGGGGKDILAGEAGDDTLAGDLAADQLYPGAGNNLLDAQSDDYVDDGGMIKSGAGTLRLTGPSTYAGGTTISGGTLTVTGDNIVTTADAATAASTINTSGDAAKLDLANNQLITTANTATLSGATTTAVTGLIQTGRNAGSWNPSTGVTTAIQTFGDTTDYNSYNADFNYDGMVNVDDYAIIDYNFVNGNPYPWSGTSLTGVTAVGYDHTVSRIAGTSKADRIIVYTDPISGQPMVRVNKTTTMLDYLPIRIDAGDGDDVISIELTGNVATLGVAVYGGDGNDTIFGGAGNDEIHAGSGDDLVNGNNGRDRIYGDDGNDSLRGGGASDFIQGGAGYDTIRGDAGNDNLNGGGGSDRIRGGDGDDLIHGGTGRDLLAGDNGNDSLFGDHNDNDVLDGGPGDNYLSPGAS